MPCTILNTWENENYNPYYKHSTKNYRKCGEKVCIMEEARNVQNRITLTRKHFIFYSYLFYVVVYDAYSCNQETRDTSKALSMRNWGHQKITLGGLDSGLLSTEKW